MYQLGYIHICGEISLGYETITSVKVLHTDLKGLNNPKIVDLCLQWRDHKIDDSPQATGFEDSRIPDDPEIDKLKHKVMEVVAERIDQRYYLQEIWAHILGPLQSTMIHSHRNPKDYNSLYLSWVYYPHQHPQDKGGRLRFQMVSHMMMNNHEVTPREGHIVFFPSWLNHYTTPNVGNDDRISISGYLKLKDEHYDRVYRDRESGVHAFYS